MLKTVIYFILLVNIVLLPLIILLSCDEEEPIQPDINTPTPQTPATPATPATPPTPQTPTPPTGCAVDTTPPQINGPNCLPADGANNVNVSNFGTLIIGLSFTEELDISTLSSADYTISPTTNGEMIMYTSGGSMGLQLSASLIQCDTTYTIGVSGIKDICGNEITTAETISFTTDNAAPIIESSIPSDGATDVYASINEITLTFDDDVDGSVGSYIISPDGNGETVVYNASQSSGKTVILDVNNIPCGAGTTYTITIENVEDTYCGHVMPEETISFSVIPDSVPPQLEDSDPENGETDVAVPLEKITLYFDEPVDGSVGTYSILPTSNGEIVSYNAGQSSGNMVVLYVENAPCDTSITYTITIEDVQDLCSNTMTTDSISFTTDVDIDGPVVNGSSPQDGSNNVDRSDPSGQSGFTGGPNVYFSFNEEIDGSGGTYTITPNSSGETVGYHDISDMMMFEMFLEVSNLQSSTTYTIELSGVIDNCGNSMTTDSISFTTQ